jgi:single-stranded-DNA-specific exonuclease
MLQPEWHLPPFSSVPAWLTELVQGYAPESEGQYIAQLLWQRGIRDREQVIGFLDVNAYQPTSPFAFGQEIKWAVQRLQQALVRGETVTIWGDFDADGITATSVLWEGLGQFFAQPQQLNYYIPNRLTESHGLNSVGIERLAASGTQLIVTCDTGSTNLAEIEQANQLGIDIIVTDHHTLPDERPALVSILNPRYFAETHPLFHLSGVAVAYKLVEALYQTCPDIPQAPLEDLLDLVAIGLIADLVQLSGDCRYLAQRGLQRLQKQLTHPTRPGVARLLQLCQRSGDRPTDIAFGLGPRINAASRIHGDANFCVELLTSRDTKRCQQLAEETELANTRRKALQKDVGEQVKRKLSRLDLSTTSVIVLDDPQWQGGVLGLIAGQIAQEYGRPTILLSTAGEIETRGCGDTFEDAGTRGKGDAETFAIARGSARSVNRIDLYQLVASQAHLLHRFGGHPFAAGLSLPVENIPLLTEGINQQLRQQYGATLAMAPRLEADLVVTVAELGQQLFRELKLLEPCGMGNPVPKLLIQNCWFENVWHNNSQDLRGNKVQYLKTTFVLWDSSLMSGFPGVWWGHPKDDIPQNQACDALVELDWNAFKKRYEVRLIALRTRIADDDGISLAVTTTDLLDWRTPSDRQDNSHPLNCQPSSFKLLQHCPTSWTELQQAYRQAIARDEPLALAYPPPQPQPPEAVWQQLAGMAKYLSRTGKSVSLTHLQRKLGVGDRTLQLGLDILAQLGLPYQRDRDTIGFTRSDRTSHLREESLAAFLEAVREEQFQRQYFYEIPLPILKDLLQMALPTL